MDDKTTLAESNSAEAVNAAAVHAEAIEKARVSQIEAAVSSAIAQFFDRGVQEKRYIDVGRIPFICDDLHGIHETLNKIEDKLDEKYVTKEDYRPVKAIVYGAVGLILTSVMIALIALIIRR